MTLLTAVIFLLVLILLGTWAASNNMLQERMAGSLRNRELALQAGEAALKHAENTIGAWRAGPFNNTVSGLVAYLPQTSNSAEYWMADSQWTSFRQVPTGSLNQVAAPPKYVIQKLPNTVNPADSTVFDVENFRVTARAVGGDSNAVVIVQSILQYTP